MTTQTTEIERRRHVRNAVADKRIEGIPTSPEAEEICAAYIRERMKRTTSWRLTRSISSRTSTAMADSVTTNSATPESSHG